MKDRLDYDYFYGGESEQFSFYRIPRQLIVGPEFKHVSTNAKLLMRLNRNSRKSCRRLHQAHRYQLDH